MIEDIYLLTISAQRYFRVRLDRLTRRSNVNAGLPTGTRCTERGSERESCGCACEAHVRQPAHQTFHATSSGRQPRRTQRRAAERRSLQCTRLDRRVWCESALLCGRADALSGRYKWRAERKAV